jgi:hypothetical protein
LIHYAEKIFHLASEVIDDVTDHRSLPRISTSLVVKAILAVYWSRLGSLNALEMTRAAKFWKAWLGRPLCSADSLGRIVARVDADTVRQGIHHVYDRLKRNGSAGSPRSRRGGARWPRDQRQLSSLL